jgi:hypothetical protein
MTTSYATVRTRYASAYLVEIGRSWHQEQQVLTEAAMHIEIPFSSGRAALDVEGDDLNITVTANSNYQTTLLEDLISEQLDRLSSDEELRYQWVRTPDELTAARTAGHASGFHFFR